VSKLTTKARKALPSKAFAEPGKRAYPLNDANHARNALARVSQFGSASEKATVRAAVHQRYPDIGRGDHLTHGMKPCTVCAKKHPGAEHRGMPAGM
jgi:hypothetical protein